MSEHESRPLREGLFEGDPPALLASRCRQCGRCHFPPRLACPDCHGADVDRQRLPTSGRVRTFTVVRNGPSLFPQPYALAYVQLDGTNLQVFAQLAGTDCSNLSVGMPVTLRIGPIRFDQDGQTQIVAHTFVPSGGDPS